MPANFGLGDEYAKVYENWCKMIIMAQMCKKKTIP
jgi:hypothetical protein